MKKKFLINRVKENSYSNKEIRKAIKKIYYLPPTSSVVLDLKSIYAWLGIEFQQVFNLYAEGYSLISIAAAWRSIHGKSIELRYLNRNYGDRVIKKLVARIQWIFSLEIKEIHDLNYSFREKTIEQNQDKKGE